MKRLIIIRHAKAVSGGYGQDYDRELSPKGVSDAEIISSQLNKLNPRLDLLIASPATRTTQTAAIFAKNLNYPNKNFYFDSKLYTGKPESEFLETLKQIDNSVEIAMLVGHNPTIFYYLHFLVDNFEEEVPTCATFVIEFNIEKWNELEAKTGSLLFRFFPEKG